MIVCSVVRRQLRVQGSDDGEDRGLHPLLQHAGRAQHRQVQSIRIDSTDTRQHIQLSDLTEEITH